jgi:hypothetical protein
MRSAPRRFSSSDNSRPRNSISNISRNAGRIFKGMSLKMSSAMPALKDDALLVCHRIADKDPILGPCLWRLMSELRWGAVAGYSRKNNVIVVSYLDLQLQLQRKRSPQVGVWRRAQMRFTSTALVIMVIAVTLLALMLFA